MREPKNAEEKPAAVEEAQLIENIRKSMEKDQYYLLCQYATVSYTHLTLPTIGAV